MVLEALLGVSAVVVGVADGLAWRRGVTSTSLEHEVVVLHGLIKDLRRTHDHRHSELDRRLAGIEDATARAETEARMMSEQLVGPAGLVPRVERIEMRLSGDKR